MWLSRAFKRHRTKSFTGGNLGNNYPNVWDRILSQTRNWLREHKIKDQLQQSKEWTWTFPSHTLQNKSFWPGLMLSIFIRNLRTDRTLRCVGSAEGCEEALTAGVCSVSCSVGFRNAPHRILLLSSYFQVYVPRRDKLPAQQFWNPCFHLLCNWSQFKLVLSLF